VAGRFVVVEHRIEHGRRFDAAEGQPGGIEAAAPAARPDLADRHAAGLQGGAELAGFAFGQVALGGARAEAEAGRIADAWPAPPPLFMFYYGKYCYHGARFSSARHP
jgi:hypothetical protein